MKVYDPSGSLTEIKSQVPNKPRVRRQLEARGRSAQRQTENDPVKNRQRKDGVGETLEKETARDCPKPPEGPRRSGETARDSQRKESLEQADSKFPEAVVPIPRAPLWGPT